MKKYKVVGIPQMHLGGPWHAHPHGKLKKNKPNKQKKQTGFETDPNGIIDGQGTYSLRSMDSLGTGMLSGTPPDDLTRKQKKGKKTFKEKKAYNQMTYDEKVAWTNKQNAILEAAGITNAKYPMPDPNALSQKQIQDIRDEDFYNREDLSTQEITDPIDSTTDVDKGYYGDDHFQSYFRINTRLNDLEESYILPAYEQDAQGNYKKTRDAYATYDPEVEELRKQYNSIEAQMRASFGDREGDPTHAEDWRNRDGRLYRKQLRALESEIQNLTVRRNEMSGENPEVTRYKNVPVGENVIPTIGMNFTRNSDMSGFSKQDNKDLKEFGYIPKQYVTEYQEAVVYPEGEKRQRQTQLSQEASILWTVGAMQGYVPDIKVPITGSVEDLEKYIEQQTKGIQDFKKQKQASEEQKQKDADYIGMDVDLLGTQEGYNKFRRIMQKKGSDPGLMKIYKDYFQEFDPNNVKLSAKDKSAMIEAGWGDGSMDAVIDLVRTIAYSAPALPFAVSALTTLMSNPLFHAAMDAYFVYETPQMVEDFYKNTQKMLAETEPGTLDRLGSIFGVSLDALFVGMGISSGVRIVKGVNKVRKTLTGATKSEAELSKILREQLSAKGKLPSRQYKQRMKDRNFRKEEELIANASLEELQVMAARRGTIMDKAGNTIIQSEAPVYITYTRKGKPGVELTDASGNVISNTGKGDVIIGMGKTERVSVPSVGSVKKVVKPTKTVKIKLGNSQIEIGIYKDPGTALQKFTGSSAAGTAKATEQANFEIAKANEVGLPQFGNASVMAINEPISIGAKELETLAKEVDVVIANGQSIVLNQKAIPQYTSKIKYKANELGFENSRIEHGSPIGVKGEPDPLFRQRPDIDQTVLKPKEKGFTLSESTGSSSRGTGIYFSQPANMQKNLKRGMPNANPTSYSLSPYGEGYIYESTIKPDAVIVDQEGMKKILNEAGYTWSTSMYDIPEEAYKILREEGVDIVVGSFEKGAVNEYNVINPEAITELSQTAKTGAKKYQVTYADRGFQKLLDFNTKAEAEAFVEKMGGKLKQKDYTGLRKDGTFDRYEHPETGDAFGIREVRGGKEEILGPTTSKIKSSDQLTTAELIEGIDDTDIPLDVNEALVKLTDEQFKQITGTDKWIYEKLVEVDPATSARTYKNKVNQAIIEKSADPLKSAEPFNKVAQEGNMPFTDILKIKTAANDGKQKAIDWVSSDQFLQRVVDSQGVSMDEAKQIQANFLDNIERIPLQLKAHSMKSKVKGALTSNESGELVIMAHAPKVEGFDSSNVMQLDDLSGTIMHEYLHAANLASGENMKGIGFLPELKIPDGAKPIVKKNIAYLNKHPEQQVRAVRAIQLAQEAGIIKANEKFTETSLKKLRDYIDEEGWFFGIAGYKDLPLLLDPVRTGNTIKDKDLVNLLNTAYQYVLPLIGGAGAATLAATGDDETSTAAIMASLPLMFTKGSMGKSFNQVFKNIRNLFKNAGEKVPFTQAELQSDILKNLPAKYKKISREKLDDLFTEDPDLIGNLIMETIIKRTGYVKGEYKKNLSEAELPIALAEQNEAAQFALDFNSAWMEGAVNSETKELMEPVIKAIKNIEPHEKRVDILQKEYHDLIETVRRDIPQDYYSKVLFGDGSVSDKEAKVIINDLISEYQKIYTNLDNRTQVGDKGIIGQMINELKRNLDIIDQTGVEALQNKYHISKTYKDAAKIAEAKDPRKTSSLKAEINIEQSLYKEANDMVMDELEKIGDISNLPLPTDIKNKVDALRNNYLPIEHINPSNNLLNRIHTNINTAEAQALEARGTLGKQAPSDEIVSSLIEGRIDDPSIKNTLAEFRADQKYLNQIKGFQSSGKYATPSQATKRSHPKKLESGDLEDVYMAYTKSKNKPKGFVKYRQDDYYSPEDVMTTIAHEDRHIYQDLLKYLEGHVEYSDKFKYNIPGGSPIGKKLREVAIDPKEFVPTLKQRLKGKKKGDEKTYESWLSSPVEIDADLAADRVEFAYGIYKKIMETPGAMEGASREDIIEAVVEAMKLPKGKKEFIENIMNSELGFRVSRHFKENYRGVINPDLDSPEVMANKEFIRLFLEALPAALIGIGLMDNMSDSESNYKKGGFIEIELDDDEALAYAKRGYIVEEIK